MLKSIYENNNSAEVFSEPLPPLVSPLPFALLSPKDVKFLHKRARRTKRESLREAIGVTLQNYRLEDHQVWSLISEFSPPNRRGLTDWLALFMVIGFQTHHADLSEAAARFVSDQTHRINKQRKHFWLLLVGPNLASIGGVVYLDKIRIRVVHAGMVALQRLNSPFGAGLIASILVKPPLLEKKKMVALAGSILPNMLTQTSALKIGELGPVDLEAIAKLIGSERSNEVISLIAIDVLKVIGTGRLYPILAATEQKNFSILVRRSLLDLLIIIKQRAETELASETLLRPSQQDFQSNLLRPASVSPNNPDELLRPSDNPTTVHNESA